MTAGAAFAERVTMFGQAYSMGGIDRPLVCVQCPFDWIVGPAVAMHAT
jgi:hypothetical protein